MFTQKIAKYLPKIIKFGFAMVLGGVSVAAIANSEESNKQVIEARQQNFKTIEQNMKPLNSTLNTDLIDWSQVSALAITSHQAAIELQSAFLKGSDAGSRAKSSIWSKPAKFNALMSQMEQGYADMLEGVEREDTALAKLGLKQVNGTCKGCHRQYRSAW
ncbi:MAG: cytochrome c [Photobacterium frigidiphilum]|uniref:c-type cytochrome n=1 Tax=Photobacterium frigidiphilum TaxID=264736 RepID=UPI003002C2BB